MKIIGIIPARFASTRFPGKPLADIAGKTMIQRVYEQASKSRKLDAVVVATDDKRIFEAVLNFGGKVVMTGTSHLNGSSRCAEAFALISRQAEDQEKFTHLVNIQGDEPLIHPEQLDELCSLMENSDAGIFTLASAEPDAGMRANPNVVKVFSDDAAYAVDFVRELPEADNPAAVYKHIGLYGFQAELLPLLTALPATASELDRKLEQLRWLDHGYRIKLGLTSYKSYSVDVPEDLERILSLLNV